MEKKNSKSTINRHDLLYHMEQIVNLAEDSELSEEFFEKAKPHTRYVGRKLHINSAQSVLMALFLDKSPSSKIYISNMADFVGCRIMRILRFMPDIDELEHREFIRCSRGSQSHTYQVPFDVIKAFENNECYVPRDVSGLSCKALFHEAASIFSQRYNDWLTYEATVEKINHLLQCNQQLLFSRRFMGYGMDPEMNTLMMLFCRHFVLDGDDSIRRHDISWLFSDSSAANGVADALEGGNHFLQECDLIEFSCSNGFRDRSAYMITAKTKAYLFTELNLPTSVNHDTSRNGLLNHESIEHKPLYFDAAVSTQLTDLKDLLTDEHYRQVCNRLQDKGFRCRFSCLFYGAPGTGKTETALQLARVTGRDIMQVNVEKLKSMWVGESEKNVKQLFDSYRQKVKELPIAPILLFNEADAIIGRRQEGAERAVEKMENSLQNIILQEMETLDGILIATTNLVQNLDKAFERRFLYKIKFPKPTVESRQSIWQSMIPELTEAEAHTLASRFDFSGGQIENVARHYTIDGILHGLPADPLPQLLEHCNHEHVEQSGQWHRVGFAREAS